MRNEGLGKPVLFRMATAVSLSVVVVLCPPNAIIEQITIRFIAELAQSSRPPHGQRGMAMEEVLFAARFSVHGGLVLSEVIARRFAGGRRRFPRQCAIFAALPHVPGVSYPSIVLFTTNSRVVVPLYTPIAVPVSFVLTNETYTCWRVGFVSLQAFDATLRVPDEE